MLKSPKYTYLYQQDVAHWIAKVVVPKLLLVFVSFSFLLLVLTQPDLEFVLIMDKYVRFPQYFMVPKSCMAF